MSLTGPISPSPPTSTPTTTIWKTSISEHLSSKEDILVKILKQRWKKRWKCSICINARSSTLPTTAAIWWKLATRRKLTESGALLTHYITWSCTVDGIAKTASVSDVVLLCKDIVKTRHSFTKRNCQTTDKSLNSNWSICCGFVVEQAVQQIHNRLKVHNNPEHRGAWLLCVLCNIIMQMRQTCKRRY